MVNLTSVPGAIIDQMLLESVLKHMENSAVIADSQNCFTKGKPCLINVVAFSNRFKVLVNEGRATDIIYLDLCKIFDTVPHNILVSKMERHRVNGQTSQWMRSWLDGVTLKMLCYMAQCQRGD